MTREILDLIKEVEAKTKELEERHKALKMEYEDIRNKLIELLADACI